MTSPHANMIGLYYISMPTLAHEVGDAIIGGPAGALRAMQELERLGFCCYDTQREIVWVYEMARFQVGERLKAGDTKVKGVMNKLRAYRDCRFAQAFHAFYKERFNLPDVDWLEAPAPEKPAKSEKSDEKPQEKRKAKSEKSDKPTHPVQEPEIRRLVKVWIEEWKKAHPDAGEPGVKWPMACGIIKPMVKLRGPEKVEQLIRYLWKSTDPLISKTDRGFQVLSRWENKLIVEMERGGKSGLVSRINAVNRRIAEKNDGTERPAEVLDAGHVPAVSPLSAGTR